MAGGMLVLPDAPSDANALPPSSKSNAAPGSALFLYVLTCCSTIGGFLFGYDTVRASLSDPQLHVHGHLLTHTPSLSLSLLRA